MANSQQIESEVTGSTQPLLLSIPWDLHLDIIWKKQRGYFTSRHGSQEARASGRGGVGGGGPAPASASELLQPRPGFPGAADECFRHQIHLALFRN